VIGDSKAPSGRDLALALFNGFVEKLLDPTALFADDMVMVVPAVQFEYGLPPLEVVSLGKTRVHELGENPIHGSQSDFFSPFQKRPVDILRSHVTGFGGFKDL
jgi:hypothetical protein